MTDPIGYAVRAVLEVRTITARRTGCPEWSGEGVRAALIEAAGTPGGALAAAALAAEDATLQKPSARAFRNHWPVNATEQPRERHGVKCLEHPEHDHPCPACLNAPRMTPEQIAEAAAKVRAEIARHVPPAVKRAQAQENQP